MARRLSALTLAACMSSAMAAPAPWYQWRSKTNGSEACARTSPGEGWSQVGGPFVDSKCRRPLRIVPL